MKLPQISVRVLLFLPFLGCLSLTGCGLIKDTFFRAESEAPLRKEEAYHSTTTENNSLSLGPDQQTLLEAFTKLKKDNIELRSRLEQIESLNSQLRAKLDGTDKNLSDELRQRAVAQAELERLKREIHRRDAEFLSLSIKKAQRDHEYYALRVAMLKDQIDTTMALNQQQEAAPPAGRQHR